MKKLLLFLLVAALIPASAKPKPKQKPWPKICLTSGCNWQMAALALGSIGGGVYGEERTHGQYKLQTAQSIREQHAALEAPVLPYADAEGYIPYSAFPPNADKAFHADRSIQVTDEDVQFVKGVINRIQAGPYRVTEFKWTIVPTKILNSAAFPDPPLVFVFSEMLRWTRRNPDIMAFVIAHEIGHTIDNQSCSGGGQAFNASLGIPAVENQFYKFCENHADNIGLQLATGAGYNPRGAIALFKGLEFVGKQYGASSISAFLGNHPLNKSRIENVEKILPIIQKQIQKMGE